MRELLNFVAELLFEFFDHLAFGHRAFGGKVERPTGGGSGASFCLVEASTGRNPFQFRARVDGCFLSLFPCRFEEDPSATRDERALAYGGVLPVIVRCIWISHRIRLRCAGIMACMSPPVVAFKRLRSCRTESAVAGQVESVAIV